MIEQAHRAMGGLDGMVLNIGTFGKTGLDNVSPEEWNRIYDVNVRGPMLCCRAALPEIRQWRRHRLHLLDRRAESRLADGGV